MHYDSSSTIGRYVEQGKQFAFVHDVATLCCDFVKRFVFYCYGTQSGL